MLAAEEGAGFAEFFCVAKAFAGQCGDAGGFDVFYALACFGSLRGEIAGQAVGVKNAGEQVVDRHALSSKTGAGDTSDEASEAAACAVG